jgi:hypothetical protein
MGWIDEEPVELADPIVWREQNGEADQSPRSPSNAYATFHELRGWQLDGFGVL